MIRGLVSVIGAAWFSALVCAPVGSADPTGPAPGPEPVPAETPTDAAPLAGPVDAGSSVLNACGLFNAAVNVAAVNYEDFAYATAGNGDFVDYQDPMVGRTNVVGRTALRQAAAAALSASRTDGLPPAVADPMRTWSLHATKLLLVMGLHGGGDSLNSNVSQLNTEGHDALMACAANGWRG